LEKRDVMVRGIIRCEVKKDLARVLEVIKVCRVNRRHKEQYLCNWLVKKLEDEEIEQMKIHSADNLLGFVVKMEYLRKCS
jgi:hypothetical protein